MAVFVFAFLSTDEGLVNRLLVNWGGQKIEWYASPQYWRVILTGVNLWKGVGFWSIVYFAGILAISPEFYEAGQVDGANAWQQARHITLPLLVPLILINVLLSIGRIFYADFGLFYQVTRNSGQLFSTTNVIDTYVFRSLVTTGDIGMASAAGFYQAIVGFLLVLACNLIVRRIDPDKALSEGAAMTYPRSDRYYRISARASRLAIHTMLAAFSLLCVLPLVLIVAASFSTETDIAEFGYTFIPHHFTTFAYEYIFKVPNGSLHGSTVTTFVTVAGSVTGLLDHVDAGLHPLAQAFQVPQGALVLRVLHHAVQRRAGAVVHMVNTLPAPPRHRVGPDPAVPHRALVRAAAAHLLRAVARRVVRFGKASTARASGQIFFQFVLPLSTPSLATVGLFCILMYWNDWYLALLFINTKALQPLQYMLYAVLTNAPGHRRQSDDDRHQAAGGDHPHGDVRAGHRAGRAGLPGAPALFHSRYYRRGIQIAMSHFSC